MATQWKKIVNECAGKIDSLIELLQGKFSKAVMEIITDSQKGLFPDPKEIKLSCSCPDWADMCKHVAAVLYGVGARLDARPEELFLLRQAEHIELIAKAGATSLIQTKSDKSDQVLAGSDLASLFGIDMGDALPKNSSLPKQKAKKANKSTIKKSSKNKIASAKTARPKAKIAKKILKKKVSSVVVKKSNSKSLKSGKKILSSHVTKKKPIKKSA